MKCQVIVAVTKDKSLRQDLKMDATTWNGLWEELDEDQDGRVTEQELYKYILGRHQVGWQLDHQDCH